MKDQISIEVYKIGPQFATLNRMINRFRKINKFRIIKKILLDFEYTELAYMHRGDFNLYLNPIKCENKKGEMLGHPEDEGLISSLLHEFGHLLNDKFNLIEEYPTIMWEKENCFLSHQSKENHDEELANLISLYMTNPFCLKLISEERYDWLKTKFTSPTPATQHKFVTLYKKWGFDARKNILKKWGIKVLKTKIYVEGKKV